MLKAMAVLLMVLAQSVVRWLSAIVTSALTSQAPMALLPPAPVISVLLGTQCEMMDLPVSVSSLTDDENIGSNE